MGPGVLRVLLTGIYVLLLPSSVVNASRVISLVLSEKRNIASEHELHRRQSSKGVWPKTIKWNATTLDFLVEVNIGSKEQKFTLAIVQNPYTWVPRVFHSTKKCNSQQSNCNLGERAGFFSFEPPRTSDSVLQQNRNFGFQLQDSRMAYGEWAKDDFKVGDIIVPNVNFGVSALFNATPALGLGPSELSGYPTFMESMKNAGLINTLTYGIYIGDSRRQDSVGRSLTFGGIDVAKFTLPLKTFDTTDWTLGYLGVDIIVNGNATKTIRNPSATPTKRARLTHGEPSIWLPSDIYTETIKALGLINNNNFLFGIPPDDSGLKIIFANNFTLLVPFSQMLEPPIGSEEGYLVLVQDAGPDGQLRLGNPFFRSSYVFYDYHKGQVSIAAAKFNQTEANIKEVGVDGESVAALGLDTLDPEFPNRTMNNAQTDGPNLPSTASSTPVGVIVGCVTGIGSALIITIAIGFWLKRWRQRRYAEPPPPPDALNPEYRSKLWSPYGAPSTGYHSVTPGAHWDRTEAPAYDNSFPHHRDAELSLNERPAELG